MTDMTLAVAQWAVATGIVFFLLICVTLILIVLIQRPQGGGLGGAFGGGAAGSGQTAFGARTGDVLTWATIGIFLLFLTVGALLNFVVLPPQAPIEDQLVPASQTEDDVTPPTGTDTPLDTTEDLTPEEGDVMVPAVNDPSTEADGSEEVAPLPTPEETPGEPGGGL